MIMKPPPCRKRRASVEENHSARQQRAKYATTDDVDPSAHHYRLLEEDEEEQELARRREWKALTAADSAQALPSKELTRYRQALKTKLEYERKDMHKQIATLKTLTQRLTTAGGGHDAVTDFNTFLHRLKAREQKLHEAIAADAVDDTSEASKEIQNLDARIEELEQTYKTLDEARTLAACKRQEALNKKEHERQRNLARDSSCHLLSGDFDTARRRGRRPEPQPVKTDDNERYHAKRREYTRQLVNIVDEQRELHERRNKLLRSNKTLAAKDLVESKEVFLNRSRYLHFIVRVFACEGLPECIPLSPPAPRRGGILAQVHRGDVVTACDFICEELHNFDPKVQSAMIWCELVITRLIVYYELLVPFKSSLGIVWLYPTEHGQYEIAFTQHIAEVVDAIRRVFQTERSARQRIRHTEEGILQLGNYADTILTNISLLEDALRTFDPRCEMFDFEFIERFIKRWRPRPRSVGTPTSL